MIIILADLQIQVIQAWQSALKEFSNVEIHYGSIFDVQCDAIVSPANSFGFMDGGIDMAISRFFGWHVQERLQEKIKTKHHGELVVGNAEIVPTDHPKIPFIISAPTMRVPMILKHDSVNIYLATRAVLLLIKYGLQANGETLNAVIQRVAIPGMGTGVGKYPPGLCARQMKQAIQDVIFEDTQYPQTWFEAQKRHQLLYGDDFRDLQF